MPKDASVRNKVIIPLHKEGGTEATFITFSGLVDGKEHIAIGLGDFDSVEIPQEGRGIGLYNKIDAYALQLEGYDTFEANEKLGFADDLRDFEVAAQMLHSLGTSKVRLLSNNPNKVDQLKQYQIEVPEMVTTGAYISAGNHSYLKAKVLKANHHITVPSKSK